MVDITIWQYSIGVILLTYNLILYITWNIYSKNYKDKKYRPVCINVVLLIIAFIYTMGLGLYCRCLMGTPAYIEFLDSNFWHWRYTPVLILFLLTSIRLTRWAYITIKINILKKNETADKKRNKRF